MSAVAAKEMTMGRKMIAESTRLVRVGRSSASASPMAIGICTNTDTAAMSAVLRSENMKRSSCKSAR